MHRWLFLIVIMILFYSCKKEVDCYGNCANIHFSGLITDTATGKGVANVPVQLIWNERGGFGLFNDNEKITESKTNKDGYFNFTATVDKNRFNDSYLSLAASLPSNYIQTGDFAYLSRYTLIP